MQLKDIGLIVFGAVLTWLYTALKEYRKKRENRKTILFTLHQEIKEIRASIVVPSYDPKTLPSWPYINPIMAKHIIYSQLLNPKKDKTLISLLVTSIKHIKEYTNIVSVGSLIIANSVATPFFDQNHKNMFDSEFRHLNNVLITLATVDLELNKITKLPTLEDELGDKLHNRSSQESSQLQNITSEPPSLSE